MTTESCPCNGTGAIVTEYVGGGISTDLCVCRRDLPRRDGKVAWWSCDTPKSWASEPLDWYHDFALAVTATRELPISEDNYPLRRTKDNAYMGAAITIEATGERTVGTDNLRKLAAWLADVADKIDEYDAIEQERTAK